MIVYYPQIFDDELMYSAMARFFMASGFANRREAMQHFFGTRVAETEFINCLEDDLLKVLTRDKSFEQIIMRHTMFPWHTLFLPLARRKEAFELILNQQDGYKKAMGYVGNDIAINFRYCPLCIKEDRCSVGEAYWHRKHQIAGVNVCYKHRCYLISSNIKFNKVQQYGLWTCENAIDDMSVKVCENENEYALSQFCANLLEEESVFIQEPYHLVNINKLLIEKGYQYEKSGIRHMNKIIDDIRDFYGREISLSKTNISNILTGDFFRPYPILEVAFFLGVSISREGGGEARTKVRISDEALALILGEYVSNSYNRRPQRLTYSMLSKKYGISKTLIDKSYPKSKAILEKYCETKEEFFIRKLIWGMDKMALSEEELTWSNLRTLTCVKKGQAQSVVNDMDPRYGVVLKSLLH